jgi:hypothetical protein
MRTEISRRPPPPSRQCPIIADSLISIFTGNGHSDPFFYEQ